MGILDKIIAKDPLWLADDDHRERKDISDEEFGKALAEIVKKYDLKTKTTEREITRTPFSEGIIASLNSLK